jgi:hypothetical protein
MTEQQDLLDTMVLLDLKDPSDLLDLQV